MSSKITPTNILEGRLIEIEADREALLDELNEIDAKIRSANEYREHVLKDMAEIESSLREMRLAIDVLSSRRRKG